MWIVFGWQKETRSLGQVATGYCYDCRRVSNWIVWNETEWATLSDIRVLKFLNKHFLHCDSCTADFDLSRHEFRSIDSEMKRGSSIDGTTIHAELMKRIESSQLSGKTALQLKFIRESIAAEEECRDALQRQVERDRSESS